MYFLPSTVLLATLVIIGVGGDLVAVVQIFRHGHRTPIATYSTDPYIDDSYWDGLFGGQLTNIGKRQHYALGQYTRKRYKNFLPTKYDNTNFYAETTDVDRTHMSAQSYLYGMFPASGTHIWRNGVDWQAIPVHPANSTIFSGSVIPNCAAYTTLLAASLNGEDYDELNEQYSSLFTYLTAYSGENITEFTGTSVVWDSLVSEDTAGFKLPSWTKSVYPEPLRTLSGKIFESTSHTTNLKRFVSGVFLNEIVEYLESMSEDSTSSQKFRVYSGHDTNIAAILNAFGAYDPPYPPAYASTIYIELHIENWQYVVKVFSRDTDTIEQISVNGCDLNCTLSNFREYLSDIIVDAETRETECSEDVSSGKVLLVGSYTEDGIKEKWADKYN